MTRDPRVDEYISAQADFARPILEHLRKAVHGACPEADETLKWGMPSFLYKGGILASMAAFKAHASFNLWRGGELLAQEAKAGAMGQFGRLAAVEDLPPPDRLSALIKEAAALRDASVKPVRTKQSKPPVETPADLLEALAGNGAAASTFEAFPPGCRRDYVEWVTEAKRPETRARRVAQAVEWMAEGKKRNWKYEKC